MPHMLAVPPKSSETRAMLLLIAGYLKHLVMIWKLFVRAIRS
jgi:hypothetical protein